MGLSGPVRCLPRLYKTYTAGEDLHLIHHALLWVGVLDLGSSSRCEAGADPGGSVLTLNF